MVSLYAPWLLRNILVMLMVILSLFLVAIKGHPLVSAILFLVGMFTLLVAGYFAFERATGHV
jgi:hypothetical protein